MVLILVERSPALHQCEVTDQKFPKGIPSLTGIRGVAAMWVMIYHLTLSSAGKLLQVPEIAAFPLFARGWAGVDLFFALSGFILMYSHGPEFSSLSAAAIVRFGKLRFFRVYPLHWAVLGLILIAASVDAQFWSVLQQWSVGDHPDVAFLRTALLGSRWLPGSGDWNEPTWSLSAEMVGYAGFPLLAWSLGLVRSFSNLCLAAVGALGALLIYQQLTGTFGTNDMQGAGSLMRMGCSFAAGGTLARARLIAPRWLGHNASILSAGAVLLIAASACSWRGGGFLPVEFAPLIFLLSYQDGLTSRLLSSRPLLFLGRVSFSFYLIHVQFLALMETHLVPLTAGSRVFGSALIVGYIAATLLLSWILHCTIERPAHRLGRLLAQEPVRTPA